MTPHHSPHAPLTLDPERTDQLRTLVTVRAAAESAASLAPPPHRGRRVAAGVVAAGVLGGAIFTATSLAGSPGAPDTPLTRVEQANALEIRKSSDGWTSIDIKDIDADPADVVRELEAAGINAQVEGDADPAGSSAWSFDLSKHPDWEVVSTHSGEAAAGTQGLSSIAVLDKSPDPDQYGSSSGGTDGEEIPADAVIESGGSIRSDRDGLSVRPDPDVYVLVLVEPPGGDQTVLREAPDGWFTLNDMNPDLEPVEVVQQLKAAGFDARIERIPYDEDSAVPPAYDPERHPELGIMNSRVAPFPAGKHGLLGFVAIDEAPDRAQPVDPAGQPDSAVFEYTDNLRVFFSPTDLGGIQIRHDPAVHVVVLVED